MGGVGGSPIKSKILMVVVGGGGLISKKLMMVVGGWWVRKFLMTKFFEKNLFEYQDGLQKRKIFFKEI